MGSAILRWGLPPCQLEGGHEAPCMALPVGLEAMPFPSLHILNPELVTARGAGEVWSRCGLACWPQPQPLGLLVLLRRTWLRGVQGPAQYHAADQQQI